MATLTSVKSGYWSDPTVWDLGVVPANGDSVTIAAGHTVIFDVDQSSFTNGLAGLTINGTLKIPSQSEDPNMPNFVCLKVNANIAGTGSFLIGSPTYPITYPQGAKVMVNGTITVATFNVYGEERLPTFDYLAQDAPAGQNQIVLQNGMPLRSGDVIVIGITGTSGSDWLYTVSSYDSSTKTVTLTSNLTTARSGTFPTKALVILLSRSVVITKYGSNSVTLVSGSGRYIKGVYFFVESGASYYRDGVFAQGISSSTYYNCAFRHLGTTYGFCVEASRSAPCYAYYCVAFNAESFCRYFHMDNCATIRCTCTNAPWGNLTNIHVHNANAASFAYYDNFANMQNITVKRGNLMGVSVASSSYNVDKSAFIENFTIVNGSLSSIYSEGWIHAHIRNGTIYLTDAVTAVDIGLGTWTGGYGVVENITIQNLNNAEIRCRIAPVGFIVRNITIPKGYISGYESCAADTVIQNLTINNLTSYLISDFTGRYYLRNISVNTYNRPIGYPPKQITVAAARRFVDILGATIGGTVHSDFRERIFIYGYVKNRWDTSPPNYTTFDFYYTNTNYQYPLYLDFKIYGSSQITISGTITQLSSGETVKVQIFSADKEPLLGDTPDFEQVYTSTGTINVSWTPPSAGEWVVRVQAEMNQTTNPVTIQNLQVGTAGGGGTTPTPVEPAFVFVG